MIFTYAVCPYCESIGTVQANWESVNCYECKKIFSVSQAINAYEIKCHISNEPIERWDEISKEDIVDVLASFYSSLLGKNLHNIFTEVSDINNIVEYLLYHKEYVKAALFIFGINTGYSCDDIVKLRVRDFYYDNNEFKETLCFYDRPINNFYSVYLNKAVKTAIEFVIQQKNLTYNNYIFCGEGNHHSYVLEIQRDSKGYLNNIITTNEKFDENGGIRECAPMTSSVVTRWLKNVCAELNISGNYSSSVFKKTFAAFLDQELLSYKNMPTGAMAVRTRDFRQLIKDTPIESEKIRETWLNLNLGLEPLEQHIKSLNALV